jgi:plasmid stabilization system protein ParE
MKIFFAPAAKLDLISIAEHIGKENPTRAVSFIDELIDHCYTLADLPRRYPLVPRYEHWGIRRSVYGNYLIFYRVREDAVDIVHVLHGAMDYESLLFPDA